VDTRSKILKVEAALQLPPPLTVVTGYFDVLRAAHVRDLERARSLDPERPLLAVVLAGTGALLDQRARAELVAALRVVDYVVTADERDLDCIVATFPTSQPVRLEAADERRAAELMEHVRRRQGR